MIINNKSTLKTLKKYLFEYRDVFYKRSFELFVLMVISIITMQKVQSIKFIYEKFISKFWNKKLNSFYAFLGDKNHSIDEIMKITTKIAISKIPLEYRKNTSIFLTIDDTLQPKFGEKFENRYNLFDHARHTGSNYMNGHCIVSIAITIPIKNESGTKYLTLPIGYKIYDKSCTKLQLAIDMISAIMPELSEFQVILLCDSWYTKKILLGLLKDHKNLKIIGALRSDTVLYDLKPDPTGKRGRPRKKGERLNYKDFEFEYIEEDKLYIATKKCLTNLYDEPVIITLTTKDLDTFSSVRVYLSSIELDNIKTTTCKNGEKNSSNLYDVYKLRWNIEVMFYQQKQFWSLGAYMVRKKVAIEKYINLIGVAYSAMILLPFINSAFEHYKFHSPQEVKHIVSEAIREELFFSNLLKLEQIKKNLSRIPYLRQFKDIEDLAS